MSLYPTPTRLRLLREVRRGEIRGLVTGASVDSDGYVVSARMEELAREGWVELDEADLWALTAAGREVLDAAGPSSRPGGDSR